MNKITFILVTLLVFSCSNPSDLDKIQDINSTLENTPVEIKGVVTGVFQDKAALSGFFIQEDALFASSGIFVNSTKEVHVGDEILINASVVEVRNETRLDSVTSIKLLSANHSFTTHTLNFPFTREEIERLEGCLVAIPNALQISDSYSFEKYGQLMVSSSPLVQATELFDAQNQSNQIKAHNDKQFSTSLVLDDLSNVKYPSNEDLYCAKNKVVVGATIKGVKGYVCQRNGVYSVRLLDDIEVVAPVLNSDVAVAGQLKLLSFNVHNLFNGNGDESGFPTKRGAKTYEGYLKQITKLNSAISKVNPDVIALMELENDGEDSLSAISQLCQFLNRHSKRGTYQVAMTRNSPGSDVIKTGIIYDASVLQSKQSSYHADSIFSRNPIFQEFIFQDSLSFVVAVNHFKSKGSRGAKGLNKDLKDGQGAYNYKRLKQAEVLLQLTDSLYTNKNVLIVGDFNAYSQEDPIQILNSQNFSKLQTNQFSYVYKGMQGDLDHAFVSTKFRDQVKGIRVLDINASYPNWTDYRFENSDESWLRSSDHNPLLIGLY